MSEVVESVSEGGLVTNKFVFDVRYIYDVAKAHVHQ